MNAPTFQHCPSTTAPLQLQLACLFTSVWSDWEASSVVLGVSSTSLPGRILRAILMVIELTNTNVLYLQIVISVDWRCKELLRTRLYDFPETLESTGNGAHKVREGPATCPKSLMQKRIDRGRSWFTVWNREIAGKAGICASNAGVGPLKREPSTVLGANDCRVDLV